MTQSWPLLANVTVRLKKQLSTNDNLALVTEGRLMILTWGCITEDQSSGGGAAASQQRSKLQVDFLRKSIRSSLLGNTMRGEELRVLAAPANRTDVETVEGDVGADPTLGTFNTNTCPD